MTSAGGRPGPPSLLEHLDGLLLPMRALRVGVIVDFDGTISEITSIPAEATLYPPCAGPIQELARNITVMAVASGRPASDIQRRVNVAGVLYVGNHGAEYLMDGSLTVVPEAEKHVTRLEALYGHLVAHADGPGVVWENKRYSLSAHYRLAPDVDATRERLAAAVASGPHVDSMDVFWGKLVLEVRARAGINKGSVVRRLVAEHSLEAAIFLGDDTTDVDGVRGLSQAVEQGTICGFSVVVAAADTPPALLESADYRLDGVPEVARFLGRLAEVTADQTP